MSRNKRHTNWPATCSRSTAFSHQGFTLLEILISLFVLSIGLLGIASMQMGGMQSTKSAFVRTQATLAAYDIIDRMRTNPNAMSTGDYDDVDSEDLPDRSDCIYTSAGCSSSGLAVEDMHEWNDTSIDLLPSATGTVEKIGNVYNITISWVEASDADDPNKALVIRMRF